MEKSFKNMNIIKNENSILFRCENYRNNERKRKGLGAFCNSRILMILNEKEKDKKSELYCSKENKENNNIEN